MTKTWSWKNVDTTFHLFLYFNILINLSLYVNLYMSFNLSLYLPFYASLSFDIHISISFHFALLIQSIYLSFSSLLVSKYSILIWGLSTCAFIFISSTHLFLLLSLSLFFFFSLSLSLSSNHLMSCFFPLISFIFTLCQTALFLIRVFLPFLHLSVFVANSPFLFLFSLISVLQSLRCFNLLPNGNISSSLSLFVWQFILGLCLHFKIR